MTPEEIENLPAMSPAEKSEEIVSKTKVLKHFDFLKKNNPLFERIEFHEDKLHPFSEPNEADIDIYIDEVSS